MTPGRRWAVLVIFAGLAVVLGLVFSPATVTARLGDVLYAPWFPAVLVGLYLLRPALAWPISAISVLVGFRYGLGVGLPVALAGVVLTSLIPFAVARRYRPEAGWAGRLAAGSERFFDGAGSLRGVVAARLAPTPAEVVSAAAGVSGVSTGAFVIGTLLGELPWTLAAVLVGHSMRRFRPGATVLDPWLAVGGALAAVLVLAGPTYRLLRRRRSEPA